MTDSYVVVPTTDKVDSELVTISGAPVQRQRVAACEPHGQVVAVLTRPANTTTYTAADALTDTGGAATAFTLGRFANGGGEIVSAEMLPESQQTTPRPQVELHLFEGTAAPTATADNAAFALAVADFRNHIGVIQFDGTTAAELFITNTGAGAAGNQVVLGKIMGGRNGIPFQCGAGVSTIWGLAIMRNAYVPLSGEVFRFKLGLRRE